MIVVWSILGIFAYVAIGGVISAILDDDYYDGPLMMTWPMVLVILLFYGTFEGTKLLVNKFIIRRNKK